MRADAPAHIPCTHDRALLAPCRSGTGFSQGLDGFRSLRAHVVLVLDQEVIATGHETLAAAHGIGLVLVSRRMPCRFHSVFRAGTATAACASHRAVRASGAARVRHSGPRPRQRACRIGEQIPVLTGLRGKYPQKTVNIIVRWAMLVLFRHLPSAAPCHRSRGPECALGEPPRSSAARGRAIRNLRGCEAHGRAGRVPPLIVGMSDLTRSPRPIAAPAGSAGPRSVTHQQT